MRIGTYPGVDNLIAILYIHVVSLHSEHTRVATIYLQLGAEFGRYIQFCHSMRRSSFRVWCGTLPV